MEAVILLSLLAFGCFVAYLLGIRDEKALEKRLISKLKKNYGSAPQREYKQDDLDHIPGYYIKHRSDDQIDDITWNDLNMDGVFARLNYCLSASGEEYLYYLLRTPKLSDDYGSFEKHVDFFQKNNDERIRLQVIFAKIGRRIRYSIYDYIDYLDGAKNISNKRHFLMLALMALCILFSMVNFTVGFMALVVLMVANIITYFRIKGDIEPYLASYSYIIKVIRATEYFDEKNLKALSDDIAVMKESAQKLKPFIRGSSILMSQSGGGPIDALVDYFKMATHADLIKFNQMYKQILANKESLDVILTKIGKIESEISVACFRESVKDNMCLPVFEGRRFKAKNLVHPLIESPVSNDIDTDRGILITGSNASGKSTFLKTCAINAIFAQTIHTVLGSEYVAPLYRVYSSMALKDDIYEGDSYYIVEIKSIKRILDASKEKGAEVLCFVDEVLRGTNTIERIAASTEILKTFAKNKVMCFAATHDIELTALLNEYYGIYHFEGEVSDNDVHFDYMIKKGPATTRNAIKLLGVLGYDENIVDEAQSLADGFLSTGKWEREVTYEG